MNRGYDRETFWICGSSSKNPPGCGSGWGHHRGLCGKPKPITRPRGPFCKKCGSKTTSSSNTPSAGHQCLCRLEDDVPEQEKRRATTTFWPAGRDRHGSSRRMGGEKSPFLEKRTGKGRKSGSGAGNGGRTPNSRRIHLLAFNSVGGPRET